MSDFIEKNGGPLVVGAVFLGIVITYIEIRTPPIVEAEVTTQIANKNFVKKSEVDAIVVEVEDNEQDIVTLTGRWNAFVDAVATAGRIQEVRE